MSAGTQAMAIDTVCLCRSDRRARLATFMFPWAPGTGLTNSDIGTAERPMPAIVSSIWPRDFKLSVGDTFTLDMGRLQPT